jgi:transcriptional regulator with XRE-family HTH domain
MPCANIISRFKIPATISVCIIAAAVFGFLLYSHSPRSKTPVLSAEDQRINELIKNNGLTLETLAEALNLTEQQVKRMKPVFRDEQKKREALQRRISSARDEPSAEKLKSQLGLFHEYYEDMYSHILDEAQFSRFMRIRREFQK